MQPVIPLDQMSVLEKLRAIEEIWNDLLRAPGGVPSPDWHGEVLKERAERVRKGTAKFIDLDEVKRRLRKRAR